MPLSRHELNQMLSDARTIAWIGSTYAHYKSPDKTYIVRDVAINEADEVVLVIYQATYGEAVTFARPLASWAEYVTGPDGSPVPRFSRVD